MKEGRNVRERMAGRKGRGRERKGGSVKREKETGSREWEIEKKRKTEWKKKKR